ncbi:MAG: YqeG family HAD IIIA-type phosphatase [Firmicutes bacterium]|nr:YqeG family HAD IIIA-type phosphatase [Bacillota bacterium]
MRDLLMPDQYVPSIYEIDFEALWNQGIRGLFFDIDNTLIPFYEEHVPAKCVKLLTDLRRRGFKVCLLSNGRKTRVQSMRKQLQLSGTSRSGKPLQYAVSYLKFKNGLKGKQIAVIGDQLFMDVLCGHLAGGMGILSEPIDRVRDEASVMKRRSAEVKALHKRGIRLFFEESMH